MSQDGCSGVEPTDGVACRHSVVSRGESECKARTANQLETDVTKKHSIDRLIGTESAESVTDWANSMVVMRFLPVLNTHRDLGFFHTTSFTNSCLWAS